MASFEFQAECKHLLDMMIHSIYSQKEIFLRELISNASDAMDKLKYISLSEKDIKNEKDFEILIQIDKQNRLLTIRDNGIGMDAKELENNLGTIAKSGSLSFREEMKAQNVDSLIGQFGVGFYSAFMVADHISVVSKKAGSDESYRWQSNGVDGFTIQSYPKETVGTDVILHIRPELEEKSDEYNQFLREYPIYKLVKKYSDYIRYPIKLYMPHPVLKKGCDMNNPEFEEEWSYETLNSMVPLWQRGRKEVTHDQQVNFYKEHFGEKKDPQTIITANIEGSVNYKALLFIPSEQPNEYGTDDFKPCVELYSSNVRIMESCQEILPEEFNFIKGIVDSPDLSLNISREMLQKTKQLAIIQNNLSKKIRNKLLKMLKNEREDYEAFHKNFGHHLKVCAMDDYGKKKESLGELLLFYSGKKSKYITLDEYVADMKPEQKYIYYANGTNPAAIDNIPQIEIVREHDMDVLYFLDQADQFVAQMFGNYQSKPFQSVVNGDLGLDDKRGKEQNIELLNFIKDYLQGRIDEVKASERLKSHPVCLSNGSGITFEMEQYFRSLSPDMKMKSKYILEINMNHDAIKKLDQIRKSDLITAKKYCEILYNQA
ncbi:MAG: molecular chaperone HtpG, partial [Holdemanella sp.]|nr:molecular chaperone HtpG [Holdemanella sp.]